TSKRNGEDVSGACVVVRERGNSLLLKVHLDYGHIIDLQIVKCHYYFSVLIIVSYPIHGL
ncbi:unnamed protein product, partial [Ilex paraguariensis]